MFMTFWAGGSDLVQVVQEATLDCALISFHLCQLTVLSSCNSKLCQEPTKALAAQDAGSRASFSHLNPFIRSGFAPDTEITEASLMQLASSPAPSGLIPNLRLPRASLGAFLVCHRSVSSLSCLAFWVPGWALLPTSSPCKGLDECKTQKEKKHNIKFEMPQYTESGRWFPRLDSDCLKER